MFERKKNMRKSLAVAGACALLVAHPAASIAQPLPGNAVATVAGEPVTKADFDHWFEITARSMSAPGKPVIPDPPSYVRCIAALRERAGARGRKAPSTSRLRAQCRARDARVRRQAVALLIQSIWFEREAQALGIEVTDARVRRALRETKRASFRGERNYRRFLKVTGLTNEDVLFRLRIEELGAAISRHVQRGAGKNKAKRLEEYGKEFQKRWRQQTECRKGFVNSQFCGNAAGSATTPT